MNTQTDYQKYRGRCKELAEAACAKNPSLRLARGHYYCPIWNRNEQHWWCVDTDGSIVDQSVKQFPSGGMGDYTEYDGTVTCSQCGKAVEESRAIIDGRYALCSSQCYGELVGVL